MSFVITKINGISKYISVFTCSWAVFCHTKIYTREYPLCIPC